MTTWINEWGKIAGLAGLVLGTLLILFRTLINKLLLTILTKKQSFTVVIIFGSFIFVLSIVTIIMYYTNNSKQLTIFVTDRSGRVVLENKGRINTYLGNRSLNELIGENGRINFPDITDEAIGDTFIVGLNAEGWQIEGNNKFTFKGEPINLIVKIEDELGIVEGVVKSHDGQDFISDALVSINTDTSIQTNLKGIFKIALPESMYSKETPPRYEITVSKQGFQTNSQYYFPKSPFEIRLEKSRK